MSDDDGVVSPDGRSITFTYGRHSTPTLDQTLDNALQLMKGDEVKAGALFAAWCQQSSEVRNLLPNLVSDYVAQRLALRKLAMEHPEIDLTTANKETNVDG